MAEPHPHHNLHVRVVTPEGSLYDGRAGFVAAPAADGEVGILPGHTALVAVLGTGELRIHHGSLAGDVTVRFAVRGGFLQVVEDDVTLLVTEARGGADIDTDALVAEREEVRERLHHPESDEQYEQLLEIRDWVETRSKVSAAD